MAVNLAELIGSVPSRDTRRIEKIPLAKLIPDPDNFYSMSGIEGLADNIATAGLQQPIVCYVTPGNPDTYTVLSGHRRREALLLLASEEPEKWQEADCIVERDDVPLEARKLRLLLANRDTRRPTSADLSRQAEDMEKYIVSLKAQGYEFPGRLQDYVAKTLETSKTKLSKLKIIREGLNDGWLKLWQDGKCSDETAYKLAHQSAELQGLLYSRYRTKPRFLYSWIVEDYAAALKKIPTKCGHGFAVCLNGRNETAKIIASADPLHCGCGRCCCGCPNLERCGHSCVKAEAEKKALKAATKEEKAERAAKEAAHDAPIIAATTGFTRRMVETAADKGIPDEDVVKALGRYDWDEDWTLIADGTKEVKADTAIPLGYSVTGSALTRLIALAELLGVSIDYLVTGKETSSVSASGAATFPKGEGSDGMCPDSGQGWKSGRPAKQVACICMVELIPGRRMAMHLHWNGEGWAQQGYGTELAVESEKVKYWIEVPDGDY